MFELEKEFQKYNFFELDNEKIDKLNEVSFITESINETLKKISKNNRKVNIQVDEIIDILDEDKEKKIENIDLKKRFENIECENKKLVLGFISILDQIEDIYRYSLKNFSSNWSEQIELLWNSISKQLQTLGIIQISDQNTFFNPTINLAVNSTQNENLRDGIIVDILKTGYIYNNIVLRKSEIIVNVNKQERIE